MSVRMSFAAAAIAFVVAARPALALDPKERLTQYRHTVWRVQDGAFESAPNAITQTADGYIWIGTDSGLVRFDGVRFQRWMSRQENGVFNRAVVSLLGASDGTLWIGTDTGLLSWKNDHLQEHVAGRIGAILEDHQHRIWVVRSRMLRARDLGVPTALSGGLCQVVGDHTGCIGADDQMRIFTADALAEDVEGNLWIGAPNQLMRWREGSFDPYLREQLERPPGSLLLPYTQSTSSIAVAADGSVWAAIPREALGVFRVVRGLPARASFQGIDMAAVTTLFIDREHSLWMGTRAEGIYRVAGQRVDHFRSEHGLSSNVVNSLFEDREGNIWVATSRGLDCFAESPVVAFSTTNELAAATVQAVLASDDGTVWIGGAGSLDALRGDKVTSMRVPGRSLTSLWRDKVGRLWVGTDHGLSVYDQGRFRAIYRPDGSPLGMVAAIAEDRDDNMWVSVDVGSSARKLFRIRDLRVQEEFAPDRMPLVRRIAADPTGGIWLGFENGNLGHYQSGKLEIFPLPNGASAPGSDRTLTNAQIRYLGLTIDADGSAWVSTWSGLVRWKNHEMKALTSKNGLPCDAIVSAIRDDQSTLWLYTKCGFVAVTDAELEQWWQQPDRIVNVRVLDVFDGAVLPAGPRRFQPAVSKSPDGRLWFVNGVVLQMIDPRGLRKNRIPPPVYVEDVRADRKDYATGGRVRLPARSRDIEIGYSALTFSNPQKVRFRHKLEGRDQEWQDAGSRRQVFYSDLPPGHYRFRVMASNNEGVWNEAGASVDFSIAPAYHQTAWFRTAMLVAVLALVWAMHRFRVRHLAHQFDARLQERVNERTRIARELHDTLLQSFHGVMFRFQAAANVLPDRPLDAKQRLETALKHGSQAIREGRDAVQGLRDSTAITNDLAVALRALGEELAASEGNGAHGRTATVGVAIQGTPHALRPIIRDDIYRIGSEALRNAFRHARARRIEVELRYDDRQFQLRVRDDGQGIGGAVLDAARPGHFGVSGMRERAELIGGHFEVWSEAGMGTEVALTIPGGAVYEAPQRRRDFWSFAGRRQANS
jgi:signal transduction histidine kinase/ligand-binding sensor domain-containing protein